MQSIILDPSKVHDITNRFMDPDGRMRVVPAEQYAQTTVTERALFGIRNAVYGFLTTELVAHLRSVIGNRTALEIGAGHGGLATALGIRATDNHQQLRPEIAAYYRTIRQPVVRYGDHVENLEALAAIAKYNPQVVVGCWVTHKYAADRHAAGGNEGGIDEEAVISQCDSYVVVGNETVHAGKSIWQLPHRKITPPWLYSRAFNGSPNFIAVWERPTPD